MIHRLLPALGLLVLLAPHAFGQTKAAQARTLHKAGKAAYAAGDFPGAAKFFLEGYELDPKPAFLINIAQSFRQANELEQAVRYYREYVRLEPSSQLKEQVEGLIAEIEEQIKARREAARPKPRPKRVVKTPPPVAGPPPPAPQPTPFYKTWWFWTAVAAVVGTGVGVGVYAGTREPDYVKEGGLGSVSW